jgi:hypothetical protein
MLLGRVTHEANHFCTSITDSDGKIVNKWIRDAVDGPKMAKRRLSPKAARDNRASSSAEPSIAIRAQVHRPLKAPRTASRTPAGAQRAQQLEEALLKRRVDEIGL